MEKETENDGINDKTQENHESLPNLYDRYHTL